MLTKKKLESIVYELISSADYDLAKNLKEETAEEPEFANDFMSQLVAILEAELKDVQDSLIWLRALEEAGVDNWEGISYAHELMEDYGRHT